MKKSYRLALETVYVNALVSVGIRATAEAVTVHKDASATVAGVGEKHRARITALSGVEVISVSAASIKFRLPEAEAYHMANPPFYTEEEKAAQEAAKAERAAKVSNVPMLDMDEDDEE